MNASPHRAEDLCSLTGTTVLGRSVFDQRRYDPKQWYQSNYIDPLRCDPSPRSWKKSIDIVGFHDLWWICIFTRDVM